MTQSSTPRLRFLSLMGALGMSGLLAACSSDPTLYTLAPVPGVAQAGGPVVVEVRTPVVSTRLDRDTIVRANEDYQTRLASGTSWSEPLSDMVGQTLTSDLAQRLPGTTVFAENDAVSTTPSAYVELTVRNFEADSAGHALVTGTLSVHPAGKMIGPVLTSPVVWQSQDAVASSTTKLTAALSQGVAAIADQAAEKLRLLPPPVTN
ncbi:MULTISPECIES: PqiC family protein [Gluconobacter]|uniref:Membrane integrity-associated transporter subunit PqiC n=1 Tax=Gluconobacter cadivus TaxID=2728101 RepID=A0ABR9YWV5_9PROT|nr:MULTISPECIES: PqiC family protein [Gluconobacter]MBF0889030.1 membrane integrity-associated transporter subunit PqiC [Gluconobacter cadivus]MBS1060375.1 membrane integrity-associated transporter subunit PqiC [Gluconobacter sp. Dm-44]